jgi:transcriptional regulator with XRE-family HTH domain
MCFDIPMPTSRTPSSQEIRLAREARGWTQGRLIEEIAGQGYPLIQQHTFSSIENGRPVPRKMLAFLLRALPELDQQQDLAAAS